MKKIGRINGLLKAGVAIIIVLSLALSSSAMVIKPTKTNDNSSSTTTDRWASEGPWGADGVCLAIDPQNHRNMFLGTYGGGIFRTTDGGETWKESNGGFDEVFPLWIKDIAVDPYNSQIVYAVTNIPSGVWRSTDGGATWELSSTGIAITSSKCVAVEPVSGTIYYGQLGSNYIGYGLYKSTNDGEWWIPVDSYGYRTASDIEIAPYIIQYTLYVSGDGVHRSRDGGQTWTQADNGLPGTPRDIEMDPTNLFILYAGFHLHEQPQIYKTVDGGDSWFQYDSGHEGDYVVSIAVDPVDTNYVYAGGYNSVHGDYKNLYKSITGGYRWQLKNRGMEKTAIYDVEVNNDRLVFAACRYGSDHNGVYVSDWRTNYWKKINKGINGIPISALASDPNLPGVVYAAGKKSGVYKRDSNSEWKECNNGLENLWITSLAVSPQAAISYLYAGAYYNWQPEQGLFKSTDGGNSWQDISNRLPDTDYVRVTDVVTDPQRSSVIYVAIDGTTQHGWGYARVYKSTDDGATFRRLDGLSFSSLLRSHLRLAVDPTDSSKIYACVSSGEGYGFYRSYDGGETWERPWGGPSYCYLGPIVVDPFRPNILYMGTRLYNLEAPPPQSLVYKSTDYGDTWYPMTSDGLPPGYQYCAGNAIVIDQRTHDLYLGITSHPIPFSGSIYRLRNDGSGIPEEWEQVGDLSVPISCLTINGDTLYAGTLYRSIKRIDIR